MMIGIRADESYNRFVAIASLNKQRFADDKPWTTAAPGGHSWYIYPIYDGGLTGFADYLLNIFVRNPRKKPPQLFRQIQCHRDFCE